MIKQKRGGSNIMNNIMGIIVSYIFVALILVSAKFVQRFGEEASRKYAHIMLCNWWFIAMYFFDNIILASIVPASFIIINYVSYKKNLIKTIERKEQEGLGTVYYAISLLVLVLLSYGVFHNPELGLVGVLVMGYADGFAAVMGLNIKSKQFKIGTTKKSIAGCLAMAVFTFLIFSIFLAVNSVSLWFIKALVIAIVLTLTEVVSIKGTDNLTVPILATLLAAICI